MNFNNYFKELKRRNVFKAALAYIVVSWIIIQVASIVFPAFNASKAAIRTILIILVIGFPVWLVFAWVYEVTPEGLKKTEKVDRKESITAQTSNKFNKLILGALAIAIILLGFDVYGTYLKKDNAKEPQSENTIPAKPASEIPDKPKKANEKSIAVLAFEDMSPQNDQEYFSDGISEEILNYLAKIPDLKVISRTSSFSYKGSNKDIKAIAQELGVAYVLEGSVRKAGDEVRITTQLIHADDRAHVWSETYDRQLKDIFKIQDDIAEEVTDNLKTSILQEPLKTTNTRAYTLYLEAKHLYNISTEESLRRSLALLKQTTEIDPSYSPAWNLIGLVNYRLFGNLLAISLEQAYQEGTLAARKAIALDPSDAEAYLVLARFDQAHYDFKKAKQDIEKALQLEPNNPEVIRISESLIFSSISRMIEDSKKSIELDPLLYDNYFNLGFYYYLNRENEKALDYLEKFEDYQPGAIAVNAVRTWILLAEGRTQEALKTIEKESQPFYKKYGKIKALYQAGQKQESLNMLDALIKDYPKEAASFADIYAFMDEREKTFEWLEKAVEIKDPNLTEVVYYPDFKKFHKDPRWQKVLEDMGVPEDNGIPGYKKS